MGHCPIDIPEGFSPRTPPCSSGIETPLKVLAFFPYRNIVREHNPAAWGPDHAASRPPAAVFFICAGLLFSLRAWISVECMQCRMEARYLCVCNIATDSHALDSRVIMSFDSLTACSPHTDYSRAQPETEKKNTLKWRPLPSAQRHSPPCHDR